MASRLAMLSTRPRAIGIAAGALVLVVVLILVLVPRGAREDEPADEPAVASGPMAPTAVCDGPALIGPASPPAGAVTVTPDDKLTEVITDNAPGTTYWLAPGTHHLGNGRYNQVIPQDGDTYHRGSRGRAGRSATRTGTPSAATPPTSRSHS